jgi:hypothetical protein
LQLQLVSIDQSSSQVAAEATHAWSADPASTAPLRVTLLVLPHVTVHATLQAMGFAQVLARRTSSVRLSLWDISL